MCSICSQRLTYIYIQVVTYLQNQVVCYLQNIQLHTLPLVLYPKEPKLTNKNMMIQGEHIEF